MIQMDQRLLLPREMGKLTAVANAAFGKDGYTTLYGPHGTERMADVTPKNGPLWWFMEGDLSPTSGGSHASGFSIAGPTGTKKLTVNSIVPITSVSFTVDGISGGESVVITSSKPITATGTAGTITGSGTTQVTATEAGTAKNVAISIAGPITQFTVALSGGTFVTMDKIAYSYFAPCPKMFALARTSTAKILNTAAYEAFQAAELNASNELVILYYSAKTHQSRDAVIKKVTSSNGGTTLGTPSQFSDNATTDVIEFRDPTLKLLDDGSMLASCLEWTAGDHRRKLNFRSTDGGANFSACTQAATTIAGQDDCITANKPIQMADGTVLEILLGGQNTVALSPYWSKSYDRGDTWTTPVKIFDAPSGESIVEHGIIQRADGLIVVMLRENDWDDPYGIDRGKLYRITSWDGETWSDPVDVTFPWWRRTKPELIYHNGNLLMSHRYAWGTTGGFVSVSHDDGLTWRPAYHTTAKEFNYGSWFVYNGELRLIFTAEESNTDSDMWLSRYTVAS